MDNDENDEKKLSEWNIRHWWKARKNGQKIACQKVTEEARGEICGQLKFGQYF